MAEELKIRIHNYKIIEAKLRSLGAEFLEEIDVQDTYFNPPKDEVIKVTEDDRGDFLVKLKAERGKFKIVKYDRIDDQAKVKAELKEKYGVKTILRKKRRFWKLGEVMININLIKSIGEFLIVEGENIDKKFVTEQLAISDPEYITVPFSDLAVQKGV